MSRELYIRPLQLGDLEAVRVFADRTIGKNYYSPEDLEEIWKKSQANGIMCSFVLAEKALAETPETIHGIRLTYAPGKWNKGKGKHLRPDLWKVPPDQVGYFQSLFIDPESRGGGWGPALSEASTEALRKLGAKAIVTHAWKESPDNSSIRYLERFGFVSVISHPNYWFEVDYECTRDGKPCRCTAEEMLKRLD